MRFVGTRLAAAAIVPVVLLTAACSSDDKKGDKKGDKDVKPAAAAGATTGAAPGGTGAPSMGAPTGDNKPAGKALTEAQLAAALLATGDVPGYTANADDDPEDGSPTSETAARPECQPLVALFADDKDNRPAQIATIAVTKDGDEKNVNLLGFGQFDGDKAAKIFADARAALSKCTSFSTVDTDNAKTAYTVNEGAKLGYGDDSLVLQITMAQEGDDAPTPGTFSFVRSGPVVLQATFLSFDLEGGTDDGVVAPELIRAQYDKLVKAQKN